MLSASCWLCDATEDKQQGDYRIIYNNNVMQSKRAADHNETLSGSNQTLQASQHLFQTDLHIGIDEPFPNNLFTSLLFQCPQNKFLKYYSHFTMKN